jgi:hypothetical protein
MISRANRWKGIGAAALVVLVALGVTVAPQYLRQQWPASVTDRLAELHAQKVPTSLEELNAQYAALGLDRDALAHFEKAFRRLPDTTLPGFEARKSRGKEDRFWQFSTEMLIATPELRAATTDLVEGNAELLGFLHEGFRYPVCHFPIKFTDGWNALLPHLPHSKKSATLLALEAVYRVRKGDAAGVVESISASLHMAEILRDDPTLVALVVRDKIVANVCHALRACLSVMPLPGEEIAKLNERIQTLLDRNKLDQTVVAERCFLLGTFMGSNSQIARFIAQNETGDNLAPSIKLMRRSGILQRDCSFTLGCLDRIERATKEASSRGMAAALQGVADDVQDNRKLAQKHPVQVNVISGMVMPGTLRGFQNHLPVLALAEGTAAALAVERYREANHRLPDSLAQLVPGQMSSVPKHPITDKELALHMLSPGYEISTGTNPDEVLFAVTR